MVFKRISLVLNPTFLEIYFNDLYCFLLHTTALVKEERNNLL